MGNSGLYLFTPIQRLEAWWLCCLQVIRSHATMLNPTDISHARARIYMNA